MNSTEFLKSITFVIIATCILYVIACLGFSFATDNISAEKKLLNRNFIRASFPNYIEDDKSFVLKIFEEETALKAEYRSFIGYRRQPFEGLTVNIDDNGFRTSTNHKMNDSIWFLGGSTMWGTGADDARTIPSNFAKITGENVLNLGESSFNSFQELNQLIILLSQGYRPKAVVFYDGVNDGGSFCNNESHAVVNHAYTSRFAALHENYKISQKKLKNRKFIDFRLLLRSTEEFLLMPLTFFKALNELNKQKNNAQTITPFNEYKLEKKLKFCDNPMIANGAAKITITMWRSAANILNSLDIPYLLVLQPTAAFHPEQYRLDHLTDFAKKYIVNTQGSYEMYYPTLKDRFKEECHEFYSCDSFVDLSKIFFDNHVPIFIDHCHVSPIGNRLIAEQIAEHLKL